MGLSLKQLEEEELRETKNTEILTSNVLDTYNNFDQSNVTKKIFSNSFILSLFVKKSRNLT